MPHGVCPGCSSRLSVTFVCSGSFFGSFVRGVLIVCPGCSSRFSGVFVCSGSFFLHGDLG